MKIFSRLGALLLVAVQLFTCVACGSARTSSSDNLTQTTPSLRTTEASDPPETTQTSQINASQVRVLEVRGFSDELNTWYVWGLVINNSDQAVNNVEIEVQLLDVNSAVLYSDSTFSSNDTLAEGESSPFILNTYEELNGVETILASVVKYETTALDRAQLDVTGITLLNDKVNNDVYLSGVVTNNNPSPVNLKSLAGILRASDGSIASASIAYPFLQYLEPGSSTPFSILFDVPGGQAASLIDYSLYLEAEFASPAEYFDLTTSQEHYKYLDSFEEFHLVGTLTNNSTANLNIRLIAGIFDDSGNCIDASSLFLPFAIAPGTTVPYDFDLWGILDNNKGAYLPATQFEIFIDWYSTYATPLMPVMINTSDDANTYDGQTATFTGNVLNDSGKGLDSATVLISMFDKLSGEMIATNYSHVSGPIRNGSSVPYTVFLFPPTEFDPSNWEFTITTYGQ